MTFTDAAAEVLRLTGRPLHYKEITDLAIENNLLSHVGKSPEVTMGARLAATLKKDTPENPLIRVKPGVFALREWDEKTIKAGLEAKKPAKKTAKASAKDAKASKSSKASAKADGEAEAKAAATAADVAETDPEPAEEAAMDAGDDEAAPPAEEPKKARSTRERRAPAPAVVEDEDDGEPPGPEEAMRLEAAARAGEIFDEEDDDDQPILGGSGPAAAGSEQGDGRRRRRRRRRGRGGAESGATATSSNGLPSYTATPAFEGRGGRQAGDGGERAMRGPQVIELTGGDGAALDDLAGRDLADGIVIILSSYERNAGAVSLRQIVETAQRRGRLSGDAQLAQSQVAAAVRADNGRRLANGQRPRFRFAGGRVALTDWLLGGDLARLENEALAAVERYREAARRAFARKLSELPGHAFVELCATALERVGMGQLRAVRRAGTPGGETHFMGTLRTGADEIRMAVVIRRDGREIGRERVTELRGALHHYGPATGAWIMTSGQVLSGAREEAAIAGTAPVALYDGAAVARMCEEHDVAVQRATLPIAIPDVDLLEALRAS